MTDDQDSGDDFDLSKLALTDDQIKTHRITPRKILKRRQHFVMVPFGWLERLAGAKGQTWCVALHLLYLQWKRKGEPIKLANGMLGIDGVSRHAKYRALADLERRGLIAVERSPGRRSPIVRVLE